MGGFLRDAFLPFEASLAVVGNRLGTIFMDKKVEPPIRRNHTITIRFKENKGFHRLRLHVISPDGHFQMCRGDHCQFASLVVGPLHNHYTIVSAWYHGANIQPIVVEKVSAQLLIGTMSWKHRARCSLAKTFRNVTNLLPFRYRKWLPIQVCFNPKIISNSSLESRNTPSATP